MGVAVIGDWVGKPGTNLDTFPAWLGDWRHILHDQRIGYISRETLYQYLKVAQ